MRIAELAEVSGVPASTLRFYDRAGLLSASRDANGYRRFGPEAVERLAFIGAAKRFGLPLEEIAAVVEMWADQACRAVRDELRPRVAERLAAARGRAAEASEFAERLAAAFGRLDAMPDREVRCDAECCDVATAPESADERWRVAPVACDLSTEAVADRAGQWHDLLRDAVREPVPDGLRLTLPADRAADLVTLATAEQQCCPFFDFRLHLDGPQAHLEVRAPEAGMEMLTELFSGSAR